MSKGSFTVLTQNAWGGAPFWAKRRQLLARLLSELRPDIVGLQEIHASNVSGEGNQAAELASLAGGYEAVFAPGRVEPSGHCEGVALLVRAGARVVEQSVVALSRDEADSLDGPYPRVVLRAAVDLPETDAVVDVMVTHLSLSKRARLRTVPEICGLVASPVASDGCSVVMGDLNATPGDPSLATFGGP
jgi:endonuclease/exonuclease/phosphatase family metal-dependent hydrolase